MLEPLWTSAQIAAATGGAEAGRFEAYGVAIDSRDVRSGDLFVALRGENTDGHRFIEQAMQAGATGVLVEASADIPDGVPAVSVQDGFTALNRLGAASRLRLGGQVIGVTGSVGKTGTKSAIAATLAEAGETFSSIRSFNNHVGVPLTLARTPVSTQFAVLEMGMNHAGELRELSALARPTIALITTVAGVHMEFFDSVEQIADAKSEIFEGLESGGVGIINRDNAYFDRQLDAARTAGVSNILSFGIHDDADVRMVRQKLHDDCSCITADVAGTLLTYKLGIPGVHWVSNSLAVLAVVHAAGADLGRAGLALADQRPPKGRGERHFVDAPGGCVLVIDESYNASPIAMQAAIRQLGETAPPAKSGRRIAVLGDMRELGEGGPAAHRNLAGQLVGAAVSHVLLVGPLMRHLLDALPPSITATSCSDAAEAEQAIMNSYEPGDLIMVKGSNAIGLSRVVDALLALADVPVHAREAG
ncbi:MAG: UDP-N-acetylmuramoyl-tripeptide--D-alanyl-D-alanine ligase [Alphaproteobacteria bacterium]